MFNQYNPKYSKEQIEWVGANRFNFTKKELIEEFNKRYNANINADMINGLLRRHNGNTQTKSSLTVYKPTPEHEEWVKSNFSKYFRYKEMLEDFNKEFGLNIGRFQLENLVYNKLNIRFDNKNATRYTAQVDRSKPLGSEYITTQGHIMVKVNNIEGRNGIKHFRENWKLKQVVVWEQANGKIPPHHKILFLDGNQQNCDLSNLRCVSSYVFNHIRSNRFRMNYYGYGKITDAMIQLLQAQELALKLNK